MMTLDFKDKKVLKKCSIAAVAVLTVCFYPKIISFVKATVPTFLEGAAYISAATVMPQDTSNLFEKDSETEAVIQVEAQGDKDVASQTTTEEQSTVEASEGSEKTSTTATTTTTTAATTTTTKAAEKNSGTKLKINETQMKNIGTNYNGIWVRNKNANHSIDIKTELERAPDIKIKMNSENPQVLIVHTHTSESYQSEDRGYYYSSDPTRTTDKSLNIVRVGDEIEKKLEKAGIKTIHATTFHDYPKYNGAYDRTLETINSYLEKYPSIEVVIDVHRDSIAGTDGTKTKPTAEINGKKAAQVMIISGCDDEGKLNFPDWEYNMRFAVRLQKAMAEKYPGLARPILFGPYRYNMHATHGSLLVEFGTEVNTLDEAIYSAQLFGNCLVDVLKGLKV